MASALRERLTDLPGHDQAAFDAIHERAEHLLRPSGALAWLDEIAAWVAGWQRTTSPPSIGPRRWCSPPTTAWPPPPRSARIRPASPKRSSGRSTRGARPSPRSPRIAGASVRAIDVGIGRPTGDIRYEAALSSERFDEIVELAFEAVDALDCDLLVLGEIGIGNTTPSAAIAAALAGGETAAWVGRGTGVDDEGLARKRSAVQESVRRIAGITDPLEILREVGGSELVAVAAATVAARHRSIPVVLDGYVVTSAVLPLVMINPAALDHCTVGHCSTEPGHRKLLERLDKRPLLDLDMRIGEGSGAMAAVPLVAMACAGVTKVPTYDEWFG